MKYAFPLSSGWMELAKVLHDCFEAAHGASEIAASREISYLRLLETSSAVIISAVGLVLLLKTFLFRSHPESSIQSAPQNTRALKRFARLRKKSKCPFARSARVRGVSLRGFLSLASQVKSALPKLIAMTEVGRAQKLDGFVFELPTVPYATDLPSFCRTFNTVLRTLAANNPQGVDCFAGDVLADKWQFTFNGVRFFITSFAEFYGEHHPRYSGVPGSAFIYLQPEYSFDWHGISSANPHREKTKEQIRAEFATAGQPYDVALVQQPHEALKYVKPLRLADPPVTWWTGG